MCRKSGERNVALYKATHSKIFQTLHFHKEKKHIDSDHVDFFDIVVFKMQVSRSHVGNLCPSYKRTMHRIPPNDILSISTENEKCHFLPFEETGRSK